MKNVVYSETKVQIFENDNQNDALNCTNISNMN